MSLSLEGYLHLQLQFEIEDQRKKKNKLTLYELLGIVNWGMF